MEHFEAVRKHVVLSCYLISVQQLTPYFASPVVTFPALLTSLDFEKWL